MASIKHAVKANEVIPKAEAREYEANSSLPLFPGRSVCIPPWQSFRAPRYAAPQAPEVKKIKAVSPGTQLVMTQWLPAQGVLIHEHWRKQYNQFVEEAAKESEDPERVLKQRAQPIVISNDTARQRNVKAVAIRKLQATKMVAFNSQVRCPSPAIRQY